MRWTGQVQPRFSEADTCSITADDGVRLRVNGRLLIDKWIDQGPTEHSGTITLTAGQKYDITMEYYERGGGMVAKLVWSSARKAKEIIPQTQLYPAARTTSKSSTLYVIDGAATTVASTLVFSAGSGASTDTVASAGGANHDGTPNNPLVYTVSGVSGTYNASTATGFSLFVDAGPAGACAQKGTVCGIRVAVICEMSDCRIPDLLRVEGLKQHLIQDWRHS